MDVSEKSPYKYCLIVKMENGVRVKAGLIIIYWKLYSTNNKKSNSLSNDDKANRYRLHYKILTYQLILYNRK